MGKKDFKLVEIPEELRDILGEPDPGTRMFRQYGHDGEEFQVWREAVSRVCGRRDGVSPGGVSMFAKVSRSGVHKRLKEGRLTAFLYHVVTGTTKWTKREVYRSPTPFVYIPVVEAERWAEVLGRMSHNEGRWEAYGDGDLRGRFLQRRKGRKLAEIERDKTQD